MEWRSRQWVAEVNHAKWCAPSIEQVRARYETELARISDAAARAPSLARCPSLKKAWGCRWRKQWRVRLGGLQTKENLSKDDLAQKA